MLLEPAALTVKSYFAPSATRTDPSQITAVWLGRPPAYYVVDLAVTAILAIAVYRSVYRSVYRPVYRYGDVCRELGARHQARRACRRLQPDPRRGQLAVADARAAGLRAAWGAWDPGDDLVLRRQCGVTVARTPFRPTRD